MTSITAAITALTDDEAIRVLAEVADYQHWLPGPVGYAPWKPSCAKPPLTTPNSPNMPSPAPPPPRPPGQWDGSPARR
jgi:hypothetical protein